LRRAIEERCDVGADSAHRRFAKHRMKPTVKQVVVTGVQVTVQHEEVNHRAHVRALRQPFGEWPVREVLRIGKAPQQVPRSNEVGGIANLEGRHPVNERTVEVGRLLSDAERQRRHGPTWR